MKHANLKGYLHGAEKVEDIFYRRDFFSTEDAHPRKMSSRATFFPPRGDSPKVNKYEKRVMSRKNLMRFGSAGPHVEARTRGALSYSTISIPPPPPPSSHNPPLLTCPVNNPGETIAENVNVLERKVLSQDTQLGEQAR